MRTSLLHPTDFAWNRQLTPGFRSLRRNCRENPTGQIYWRTTGWNAARREAARTLDAPADREAHCPSCAHLFAEMPSKVLALNEINGNCLIDLFTGETDKWVGQPVAIYRAKCDFQGKQVCCVRLLGPQQPLVEPVYDLNGYMVQVTQQQLVAPQAQQAGQQQLLVQQLPQPQQQQQPAAGVQAPQLPVQAPPPQQQPVPSQQVTQVPAQQQPTQDNPF